jgi:hypothetical protein
MGYQVYVLKLENGKYFIGYTISLKNLREQLEKKNIKWLQKNSFIKILKVYNNCDKFDVDKYTKKYMELYGIENVRGGSYYHFKLNENVIKQIEKEFDISNQNIYENEEEDEENKEEYIEDSFDKLEKEFEIINKCSRCGSNDHYVYQCFVEFEPVSKNIKRCKRCREYGHEKKECPVSKHQKILEKFQKIDNKVNEIIKKLK